MALSINSYTNNTSIVLAVEITESNPRKVLLFAADAQTGNWLSWQDLPMICLSASFFTKLAITAAAMPPSARKVWN